MKPLENDSRALYIYNSKIHIKKRIKQKLLPKDYIFPRKEQGGLIGIRAKLHLAVQIQVDSYLIIWEYASHLQK